jgi:hypothetical protein
MRRAGLQKWMKRVDFLQTIVASPRSKPIATANKRKASRLAILIHSIGKVELESTFDVVEMAQTSFTGSSGIAMEVLLRGGRAG